MARLSPSYVDIEGIQLGLGSSDLFIEGLGLLGFVEDRFLIVTDVLKLSASQAGFGIG
jgi:hypothetical protein